MADPELRIFDAPNLTVGVEVFSSPLSATLRLDPNTKNVSTGINQGVGPRYGMAPLPGHNDNEAAGSPATRLPGCRRSEEVVTGGLNSRVKIFAVFPIDLGIATDFKTRKNHYAWIVGRSFGSQTRLDLIIGSTLNPGAYYDHSPNIAAGLYPDSISSLQQPYEPLAELVSTLNSGKFDDLETLLTFIGDPNFLSAAVASISGKAVPCKTMVGRTTSTPGATTAPNINFNLIPSGASGFGTGGTVLPGATTEFQLQRWKEAVRHLLIVCLGPDAGQLMGYNVSVTPSAATFKQQLRLRSTVEHLDLDGITATKIGASVAYSSVRAAYVKDVDATVDSSYKAIMIAGKKSVVGIIQEWYQNLNGTLVQWMDLSNIPLQPKSLPTNDGNTVLGRYTERGVPTPTCFASFPIYVNDGTPLVPPTSLEVSLFQNPSGIFEQDTTYEFTYALYYKRLDYETNVGAPAKFVTGPTGPYSLGIAEPQSTEFTNYGNLLAGDRLLLPFPSGGNNFQALNFIEYRFYFRQFGTFEWRPCGTVDAADYWFGPFMDDFDIGKTPVGATVGGQPGGFNDYSQLPKDEYKQVLFYKDRAFWFSDKSIQMSNRRNIFAYPARNAIPAPTGKFRGGTVHIQPGETEQTSRLVIWGSDQSYVGRFTGIQDQYSVQVSIDTLANFPLDGSDFNVDLLCEATAYSYRSAIVAEGVLYFWGPQGIYRDNGISEPKKASGAYEPTIFDLVDPARIEEVHCTYNKQTKEIVWFYPPRVADDYPTHMLVFNVITGEIFPGRSSGYIDASQSIKIENDESPTLIGGERTIAMVREDDTTDIQRPYFFDHRCRSGDIRPTTDMMVKSFTTPIAGRRELTLAAGFDATKFATIAVGDIIALTQLKKYATSLTLADDFLGKVVSKNVGAGTIVITVPSGVQLDASATLDQPDYFPIWHAAASGAGLNGIPWNWETLYWMPGGLNYSAKWMHLALVHKLDLLPSVDRQKYTIAYRGHDKIGDIGFPYVESEVRLENNCDGVFQRYHNLEPGEDETTRGQALKVRLSGFQIGSGLVLQYLQVHGLEDQGNDLKRYQDTDEGD